MVAAGLAGVQQERSRIGPLAREVAVDGMRDGRLPDVQVAVAVDVTAVNAEAIAADERARTRVRLLVLSVAGAREEVIARAEARDATLHADIDEGTVAVVFVKLVLRAAVRDSVDG